MNFRPGSNVADLALHKDGRIDCFEGFDRFFGLAHVLLEWQRGKIEADGIKPGPGRFYGLRQGMGSRSRLDRSDVIHSASRSADSATNRRDAADFEVPSAAMTGRSPSGSRTARLSLRVDTLISIRFMAQRPSQSSACAALQVGSATSWPS